MSAKLPLLRARWQQEVAQEMEACSLVGGTARLFPQRIRLFCLEFRISFSVKKKKNEGGKSFKPAVKTYINCAVLSRGSSIPPVTVLHFPKHSEQTNMAVHLKDYRNK